MSELSAAALRRAFQRSFAEPVEAGAEVVEDYLAIRLGGDPHALRLADVACIAPWRPLARYPSPAAGWLGLAGVDGAVLPVYDLAQLMGYARGPALRWMVTAKAAVALAFEAFEGQFRLSREPGAGSPQVVQGPGGARPVVPVDALVATLRSLAPERAPQQEA